MVNTQQKSTGNQTQQMCPLLGGVSLVPTRGIGIRWVDDVTDDMADDWMLTCVKANVASLTCLLMWVDDIIGWCRMTSAGVL